MIHGQRKRLNLSPLFVLKSRNDTRASGRSCSWISSEEGNSLMAFTVFIASVISPLNGCLVSGWRGKCVCCIATVIAVSN